MKLFSRLFKKTESQSLEYDPEDLKKIKKKDRKKALQLLREYNKGIVIRVDKDINQRDLMFELRKTI